MLNPPRGDACGGKPFSRGALYNILSNPIYLELACNTEQKGI